jgi:GH25 family lysozyme M1 (1,4-beta-N-acetylmuramidase)
MGIDVSFWQDEVNWPLVKAAGMEFVMIRLAWRGSSEGVIEEDSWARINYRGAKDAGMLVGGYFFSQALTPEEAVEEAEFVLAMAEEEGMVFDMPIVFDWEQTWGRTSGMDPDTLTECAKAFCQRIEEAGLEAMIYFGVYQAHYGLNVEELTDYRFWLAMYDSEMDFPYKVNMWQYTDSGSVPGINGAVDLNIYFEYEEDLVPKETVPQEETLPVEQTVPQDGSVSQGGDRNKK